MLKRKSAAEQLVATEPKEGGGPYMRAPIGTTAKTGQNCPESGVWEVVGTPSTTAPITKGETMPPYRNQGVTWKLISYA